MKGIGAYVMVPLILLSTQAVALGDDPIPSTCYERALVAERLFARYGQKSIPSLRTNRPGGEEVFEVFENSDPDEPGLWSWTLTITYSTRQTCSLAFGSGEWPWGGPLSKD